MRPAAPAGECSDACALAAAGDCADGSAGSGRSGNDESGLRGRTVMMSDRFVIRILRTIGAFARCAASGRRPTPKLRLRAAALRVGARLRIGAVLCRVVVLSRAVVNGRLHVHAVHGGRGFHEPWSHEKCQSRNAERGNQRRRDYGSPQTVLHLKFPSDRF